MSEVKASTASKVLITTSLGLGLLMSLFCISIGFDKGGLAIIPYVGAGGLGFLLTLFGLIAVQSFLLRKKGVFFETDGDTIKVGRDTFPISDIRSFKFGFTPFPPAGIFFRHITIKTSRKTYYINTYNILPYSEIRGIFKDKLEAQGVSINLN